MNTVNLADITFRDLSNPDDVSIPNIVFWYETHIGVLNTLLETGYTVDANQQLTPELGDAEAAIYENLYLIYYYDKLVRTNLGAGAYDWSELTEGDSHIRRVSRNEIAKSFIQLKKALEDRLNRLVFLYQRDKALPVGLAAVHDLIRYYRYS
jgi:hypothetical protein